MNIVKRDAAIAELHRERQLRHNVEDRLIQSAEGHGKRRQADTIYISNLADEIAELKAQIEAMTPDYCLGQLVRRMPELATRMRTTVALVVLTEHSWIVDWESDCGRKHSEAETALLEAFGENWRRDGKSSNS